MSFTDFKVKTHGKNFVVVLEVFRVIVDIIRVKDISLKKVTERVEQLANGSRKTGADHRCEQYYRKHFDD